jgi:hypothetical protein
VHSVMIRNRIGYVMVSVFSPSDVDHGFEPLSGEANDNTIWYMLLLR